MGFWEWLTGAYNTVTGQTQPSTSTSQTTTVSTTNESADTSQVPQKPQMQPQTTQQPAPTRVESPPPAPRTTSTREAGADFSGIQIPQPSQPAVARPDTITVYVPYGEQRQIEVQNIHTLLVDREGGGLAGYEIPAGHSITNIATSGGPGAAQSGMFSLEPGTPVVVERQRAILVPGADKAAAAAVIAAPEKFSRLGAEAYGGRVMPLDTRTVASTRAEMGRYPSMPGNLANLVSPTGVNQRKEMWAEMPWRINSQTAPKIGYVDVQGRITPIVPREDRLVGGGRIAAIPITRAEVSMQPLAMPAGLKVIGAEKFQPFYYEMEGGKRMWVLTPEAESALPINKQGQLIRGIPSGTVEPQNLTGQPVPEPSVARKLVDIFTMENKQYSVFGVPIPEYIETGIGTGEGRSLKIPTPVGMLTTGTRFDKYFSIGKLIPPAGEYVRGEYQKGTVIGALTYPFVERTGETTLTVGAAYLTGVGFAKTVGVVAPVAAPYIAAAPGGRAFLQYISPASTVLFGSVMGAKVIVDTSSAPKERRVAAFTESAMMTGIEAYAFMKGANPEFSLRETFRPASNTIRDTARGGARRVDEALYGMRQRAAGFENIGVRSGSPYLAEEAMQPRIAGLVGENIPARPTAIELLTGATAPRTRGISLLGRYTTPSDTFSGSPAITRTPYGKRVALRAYEQRISSYGYVPQSYGMLQEQAKLQLWDYRPTAPLTEISTVRTPDRTLAPPSTGIRGTLSSRFDVAEAAGQRKPDIFGINKFVVEPKPMKDIYFGDLPVKERWAAHRKIEKHQEWLAARTGIPEPGKSTTAIGAKKSGSLYGGGGSARSPVIQTSRNLPDSFTQGLGGVSAFRRESLSEPSLGRLMSYRHLSPYKPRRSAISEEPEEIVYTGKVPGMQRPEPKNQLTRALIRERGLTSYNVGKSILDTSIRTSPILRELTETKGLSRVYEQSKTQGLPVVLAMQESQQRQRSLVMQGLTARQRKVPIGETRFLSVVIPAQAVEQRQRQYAIPMLTPVTITEAIAVEEPPVPIPPVTPIGPKEPIPPEYPKQPKTPPPPIIPLIGFPGTSGTSAFPRGLRERTDVYTNPVGADLLVRGTQRVARMPKQRAMKLPKMKAMKFKKF